MSVLPLSTLDAALLVVCSSKSINQHSTHESEEAKAISLIHLFLREKEWTLRCHIFLEVMWWRGVLMT